MQFSLIFGTTSRLGERLALLGVRGLEFFGFGIRGSTVLGGVTVLCLRASGFQGLGLWGSWV